MSLWDEMTEAQQEECNRVDAEVRNDFREVMAQWRVRLNGRADLLKVNGNPNGAQLIRNRADSITFIESWPEPEPSPV